MAAPAAVRVRREPAGVTIEILGLRTVAEINRSRHEHPMVKAKRVKDQHTVVAAALHSWSTRCPYPLPIDVTLTRLSSGRLDEFDNLPSALKAVADAVAYWARGSTGRVGAADADAEAIRFRAAQERVPRGTWGVRIEIRPRATP